MVFCNACEKHQMRGAGFYGMSVVHAAFVLLTAEASLPSVMLTYHALTIPALREQECSASVCWSRVLPQGFMNLFLNCYLMPKELGCILISGLITEMW